MELRIKLIKKYFSAWKFTNKDLSKRKNFNLFLKVQFIQIDESMLGSQSKSAAGNFDKWLAVLVLLIWKFIFKNRKF